MYVVNTIELTKVYSNSVKALKNVNIKISKGDIHCILGRNGAGKTTLLRILGTQLMPTSGEAYVFGFNVVNEADKIRKHIAVVPQEGKPYNFITPWNEVYLTALLWGMDRSTAKSEAKRVLEIMGLWEHRNKLNIHLSGGLKQRLLVARALVTGADLLMLDEPTIGIDPVGRRTLIEDIKKLKKEGKTIILTTHYMDEAEKLADKITIIDNGRVIGEGTAEELIRNAHIKTAIYIWNGKNLEKLFSNWEYYREGDKYLIYAEDEEDILEILRVAVKNRLYVNIKPPSLEDAFIKLVGGE